MDLIHSWILFAPLYPFDGPIFIHSALRQFTESMDTAASAVPAGQREDRMGMTLDD